MCRFYILLFTSLLFSHFSFAQQWLWAKNAKQTGNYSGGALNVAMDSTGNIYQIGSFNDVSMTIGTYTLASTGGDDIFLAKHDMNGNILWAKSMGGTGFDLGTDIATDKAGNVYITGRFQSPSLVLGTYTLTNAPSNTGIFLAKYDAAGNVMWATSAGGPYFNGTHTVTTDIHGDIYIAGYFTCSSLTFGAYSVINASGNNSTDAFIAKFDPNGNALWVKTAQNGSSYDYGYDVASDAWGNVYMTGSFASGTITFGNYTLVNSTGGGDEVFLVKYDASGQVIWATSTGNKGTDGAYSIAVDRSGNSYICGYFTSATIKFGSYTLVNSDNSMLTADAFLAKYNSSGKVIWATSTSGGHCDEEGLALATDTSGNVYMAAGINNSYFVNAGFCSGTSLLFANSPITFSTTPTFENILLVKLNSSGSLICYSTIANGDGQGEWQALTVDPVKQQAYIAGRCVGPQFIMGKDTLSSPGRFPYIAKWICGCEDISANTVTTTSPICNQPCTGTATVNTTGGSHPYQYSWNTSPLQTTSTASQLCTGNYILTISDTTGCSASQTVTIHPPTAITLNSVIDDVKCAGDMNGTIAVTAANGTAPYTYVWSPGSSTGNVITSLPSGTYTVLVSDKNQCTKSASFTLTSPLPLSVTGSVSHATCPGMSTGSASASVNGGTTPYNYLWVSGGNIGSTISNQPAGSYTLTVNDKNNCTSTIVLTITEPLPLISSFTVKDETCEGDKNGMVSVSATGGTMPYLYTWDPDGIHSQTLSNVPSGIYNVTVTDHNNCFKKDSIQVHYTFPKLLIKVGNDTTLLLGESCPLFVSGGNTYTWSPGNGLSCINCSKPIATPEQTTLYHVIVADTNGCTSEGDVVINIHVSNILFIPDIFSPDGDGHNDVLYVRGKYIKRLLFAIYDRWGEKVFESTDPAIGWNGDFRGKQANTDIYVYTVEAWFMDDKKIEKKGTISLLR